MKTQWKILFAFLLGMAFTWALGLLFNQETGVDPVKSKHVSTSVEEPSFSGTVLETMSGQKVKASEIVDKILKTYESCESYQDTGIVKTVFIEEQGQRIDEKPFSTAFKRTPLRFRFEYQSKFPFPGASPKRHIVWCEGEEVRVWWDIQPGVTKPGSLKMAIAGATGVSGGSAVTIPNLLMPNMIDVWSIPDWTHLERLFDGEKNGASFYRIQGTTHSGDKSIVWINKKNFLVHRIDEKNQFSNFQTETTTIYVPRINADISPVLLEFNAPEPQDELVSGT